MVAITLWHVSPALGQRARIDRPSVGPSGRFTSQTQNLVGGHLGTSQGYGKRSPRAPAGPQAARALPSRLNQFRARRRQAAASRRQAGLIAMGAGNKQQGGRGAPLAARRRMSAKQRARSEQRGRYSTLTSLYYSSTVGGPLGLGPSRYTAIREGVHQTWVQPEVVVEDRSLRSLLAGTGRPQARGEGVVTVDDLIENYIHRRRDGYVSLAWEHFQAATSEATEEQAASRYRKAFDLFLLADAVARSAPAGGRSTGARQRAEVKLGIVFAGVASRQNAMAINSLRWLLTRDPKTGQLPDPDFLIRNMLEGQPLTDVAKLSTSATAEVEQFSISMPASIEAQALYAFVLWQGAADGGMRNQALARARRIDSSPGVSEPWSNLYQTMVEAAEIMANAGEQPSAALGKSMEDTSNDNRSQRVVRLPWEDD